MMDIYFNLNESKKDKEGEIKPNKTFTLFGKVELSLDNDRFIEISQNEASYLETGGYILS